MANLRNCFMEPIREDVKQSAVELFKILGDETRMQIICYLLQQEMCVSDIAEKMAMSSSAVSHQLRVLRQTRLVRYSKRGRQIFYSLDDEHVEQIVNMALLHVDHALEK